MAHQTEAACLLDSGAIYWKRAGMHPGEGDPIFAGFKRGAFSLYFGDAPIYHFDLEGRWQRAFVAGVHFLKGLDGLIQAIDRVREGKNLVLKRRTLGLAESRELDDKLRQTALGLIDAIGHQRFNRKEPPPGTTPLSTDDLRDFLERVARWDETAWRADRDRFLATYGPMPFLPPDCLNAVVLQATGDLADFEKHARAVADLYGRRITQCRAVFLDGSDVLRRPFEAVIGTLEIVARVLPLDPNPGNKRPADHSDDTPILEGVHAVLDDPSPPRPSRDDWKAFALRGLKRVSLMVESGDPEVRALYHKSWNDEDLRLIVADLKAAGIGVGVMVLVGAGGVKHAEPHMIATAALVNSLALGPGDLVSLLDAQEVGAPIDPPLVGPAWADQLARFKAALTPVRVERGAKVVPYSREKQGV